MYSYNYVILIIISTCPLLHYVYSKVRIMNFKQILYVDYTGLKPYSNT